MPDAYVCCFNSTSQKEVKVSARYMYNLLVVYFRQNPDRCAALPDEVLNKRLLPAICQVFLNIIFTKIIENGVSCSL